jgi:hypothetical protein
MTPDRPDPLADLRYGEDAPEELRGAIPDCNRAEAERRLADAKIAWQVANGWPTTVTMTVTFTMTPEHRAAYAGHFELGDDAEGEAAAARDWRDHLGEHVDAAFGRAWTFREFTRITRTGPKL